MKSHFAVTAALSRNVPTKSQRLNLPAMIIGSLKTDIQLRTNPTPEGKKKMQLFWQKLGSTYQIDTFTLRWNVACFFSSTFHHFWGF